VASVISATDALHHCDANNVREWLGKRQPHCRRAAAPRRCRYAAAVWVSGMLRRLAAFLSCHTVDTRTRHRHGIWLMVCVWEREREREYVLNHNRTMLSCIFCPHVTKIVCRNVLTTRQLSVILALKKDCFTRQTSSSGKRTILYHRCLFIRGLSASCK